MTSIRYQADRVRHIALTTVLQCCGATADKDDHAKWHTSQGVVSVNGEKFYNWTHASGGGGAIDLVMHLREVDFIAAVNWLVNHFGLVAPQTPIRGQRHEPLSLRLPQPHPSYLARVIDYLTARRCLSKALVQSLIGLGRLYADAHANAVFPLLGKDKRWVGAEIRGTGSRCWHAMAPGSRKDLGCFSVAHKGSQKIVLCESAIDAMSYAMLDGDCRAFSTAGAHPNPPWVSRLIDEGFDVYCGFDADTAGDNAANKMISLHPTIKRVRPGKHDWNDVLKSQSS